MEKKSFSIQVGADAPAIVSVGNLTVEKKNDRYDTDHARFAEYLQITYGSAINTSGRVETEVSEKPLERAGGKK